jgi:chorismate lyase/3-hydroxybenzoate synthase
MGRLGALTLDYVSLRDWPPERRHGVLGAALFDRPCAGALGTEDPGFAIAEVPAPVLGDSRDVLELWSIGEEVRSGTHGAVRYTRSRDLLFGSVALAEEALGGAGKGSRLHAATLRAYREIFAALGALGHAHLVRIWNFIPEINRETHGLERYRQFNSARQEALLACGRWQTGTLPAASALGGTRGSPLVIYFIASRHAPVAIENPRQVSAYHYPEEYGPRSPAFSRAAALGPKEAATLFVSGTSSIVGHRTVHAGDVGAQTRESLTNIEAVVDAAGRGVLAGKPRLESLTYKVYVRDPRDLPVIRAVLTAALGDEARVLFLGADICRIDLAVEIEAVSGMGLERGSGLRLGPKLGSGPPVAAGSGPRAGPGSRPRLGSGPRLGPRPASASGSASTPGDT